MNGRQARKLLKNMRVLHLEPGDMLVMTLPMENPPQSEMVRIQKELMGIFMRQRVLVVPKGFQFSAIREETT